MKNKFEIIIRPKTGIKSRQWWKKQVQNLQKYFSEYLNSKSKKLFNHTSITLLVTKNKEIQSLNKKFRGINRPTDVLSFHLNKKEQLAKKYLGDIVISTEYASKLVLKKKLSLEKELQALLIHGYLHLLGYDHKLPKEAKSMFSIQNKLLNKLVVSNQLK